MVAKCTMVTFEWLPPASWEMNKIKQGESLSPSAFLWVSIRGLFSQIATQKRLAEQGYSHAARQLGFCANLSGTQDSVQNFKKMPSSLCFSDQFWEWGGPGDMFFSSKSDELKNNFFSYRHVLRLLDLTLSSLSVVLSIPGLAARHLVNLRESQVFRRSPSTPMRRWVGLSWTLRWYRGQTY